MGRRGPPPASKDVLKMRGSWRAKIAPDDVQAVDGVPVCPSWMPAKGKAEWKRVCSELAAMRVLSKTDRASIVGYCLTFAELQAATEAIEKEGRYYATNEGQIVAHPAVKIQNAMLQKLKQFCGDLGLSPATRTRVSGAVTKADDDGPMITKFARKRS